ncbi:SMI1/KNR4 family protein [Amycolatopsis samaneae]|uniref:SMI1/KNR4 family protein n=1 Tax=Amycolatopsis samaneae TaxID=664691 RepID=A0ABW5GTZ5_9PSEU
MEPGDIAREMALLLRSSTGSPGWTNAVLRIWVGHDGYRTHASSDTEPYLYADVSALVAHLPWAFHELRLSGSGTYTYLATPGVGGMPPTWILFDRDHRYPRQPRPGMPLPARSRPTGAPTDPAVLARVTALADEFAKLYAGIKGRAPEWAPGCTEAQLAEAEERIGARLPEDLRALYRVTDWDGESGLLGSYAHDPLRMLVERYHDGDPGFHNWQEGLSEDGVVFETPPAGRVKRLSRNDWWITFGSDHAGDMLAVDLDPAEHGTSGQVLEYGRNVEGPLRYVASSVTAMLEEVLHALRAGEYHDEGPPYRLIAKAAFAPGGVRAHYEALNGTTDVSGVPDPGLVQELFLNDAGDVDLTALEPLSSLRRLRVNRADSVVADLSALPVLEAAELESSTVDLRPLAEHPALWSLSLTGVKHPIDLSLLTKLPRLARLQLAGLDVPELERVGELTSLRVLTVDDGQLRRLVDSGAALPPLAALEIIGTVSLAELVDLRARLRPDAPPAEVVEASGTLS